MQRKFPRKVKRIVIKVGSSVIATYKMKPRVAHLRSLVEQICEVQKQGVEVVLVSSGAIVLGMGELGLTKRPKNLSDLQALAAVGQTVLMQKYSQFFKAQKKNCAQVLLTWDDFDNRGRYTSARSTFQAILDRGIVPIVNENDTISTEEIKFGDNDKLSALVACQVEADLLLVLSDVEGLYDLRGGEKKVFDEITDITGDIEGVAGEAHKEKAEMSKGGMSAKLRAIKMVVESNIPCVIAKGEMENVLLRVLNGERIGTFFTEKKDKLLARRHWISFGAKPKGVVVVDDGAKRALLAGGKSLLLPGIIDFEGHFQKDDVVVVQDRGHQEIARGIINYSLTQMSKIEDKKNQKEAIHVDDLVLSQR